MNEILEIVAQVLIFLMTALFGGVAISETVRYQVRQWQVELRPEWRDGKIAKALAKSIDYIDAVYNGVTANDLNQLNAAVDYAKRYLSDLGINVNTKTLSRMIEAEANKRSKEQSALEEIR